MIFENGCPNPTLPELLEAHEIIRFSGSDKHRISEEIVENYRKGLSLREIVKLTGKAKTVVRSTLLRAGVELRERGPVALKGRLRERGARSNRPYYGFYFLEGEVVRDPREYPYLLLIHRLWKLGTNPSSIAATLNSKNIPARKAASWNRNSVIKILNRFEDGTISIKGAKYELR